MPLLKTWNLSGLHHTRTRQGYSSCPEHPLSPPSANFSKELSSSDFDDLHKQLRDIVSLILNVDVSHAEGLLSTLVKVVGKG